MSVRINSPNQVHVRRGSLRRVSSSANFAIDIGKSRRGVVRESTCNDDPTLSHLLLDWKWACRVLILVFVTSPRECSSDYNVILPEICNHVGKLNLTWIHSMVHLGIREEQVQHALNILNPEDVCDGSDGLLKFISLARSNPNGRMIASLKQPLCPTAATFSHLNKRHFISWTCSQMPGIQSIKPGIYDVILAIQHVLDFYQWSSIALTKSRFDRSPFCDEVGAYLQNDMKNNPNISVITLGNYEDLDQYEFMSFSYNLDGLFLCVSYDYGFTHNLSLRSGNELKTKGRPDSPKTVLLLQWPLPVELFSPGNPTLAVVADTYPRIPTTSSFDFQQKSWDALETSSENILPHKLLETLLAQMILKSVKLSLDSERKESEREVLNGKTNSISSSSSAGSSRNATPGGNAGSKNTNHNFHHFSRHFNGKGAQSAYQQDEHQFLFSLLQFEKARWHPLINLVNGEKHFTSKGPSGLNRRTYVRNEASTDRGGTAQNEIKVDEDYLVTWLQIVLGMIATVIIAGGVVIAAIYTRRKARKRDFSSAKHCRKLSRRHRYPGTCKLILTPTDLTFGPFVPDSYKKPSKSPFIGSLPSFQRNSQEKPDLIKGSFGIATSLRKQSSVTNMKNEAGILTGSVAAENTARYKGDPVYLKKLPILSSEQFDVKVKAMLVIETIHGLRHENLVALLGCFIGNGPASPPALIWEYCSRGSLHDIIKQSDIKLDWAFKLSLLTDLVRGMRYLHSSMVRVHGFLTSHNCVIDARWVLKITDYGLPAFYYTQGLPLPPRSSKELLWTAPELLRDESLRQQGTQAGDVYSFAIIMQEILVRGEPYCMLTLTADEILEKVKRPPPLIRPSVSKGAAVPEAINIMRQCWAELPDMRPDFMVIHDLFKTLNHGRKANIVDTMFQMLEKYSNNLEELIRERTEQLDLEKKKTEQLLNRMLPNTVAEKLKLGLPVDPEEFSEVTIYFSDIVGFTTISAYSTPFEVVDLLNDLYTCFDATINDYNVYKVETIGDAYMVVGGAPLWSPDHADQIATMALDLLHQSGKFRIRHLPYTPLRLRIGLHTGSCCAGVVGLTMPRYCLFGDTVNTASRMESTGAPWRIHVSAETKAKLDEAGGYIIEYRGMTDIKGKGPMRTYWLLGKEGFDKELPTPPGLDLDENAIKYGRTGVWPDSSTSKKDPYTIINKSNVMVQVQGVSNSPGDGFTTQPTTASFGGRESISPTFLSPILLSPMNSRPGSTSPHHLAPPKSTSSFAVVSGRDNVRSLSPAEQIAHQLLNGRPTTKGLRRQLSLDHRAMPILLQKAQMANIRRAPSLEENLEQNPSGTSASSATCNYETGGNGSNSPSPNANSSSLFRTSGQDLTGSERGGGGLTLFPKSPTSPNVSSCVTHQDSNFLPSTSYLEKDSHNNSRKSLSRNSLKNPTTTSGQHVVTDKIKCVDVKGGESPNDVSISIPSSSSSGTTIAGNSSGITMTTTTTTTSASTVLGLEKDTTSLCMESSRSFPFQQQQQSLSNPTAIPSFANASTKESLVQTNNNHSRHTSSSSTAPGESSNEQNANANLKNHSQIQFVWNGGEQRIPHTQNPHQEQSHYSSHDSDNSLEREKLSEAVGGVAAAAEVHSASKINSSANYVVVDANAIASVNSVPTGLTVHHHPGSSSFKCDDEVRYISESVGGGGGGGGGAEASNNSSNAEITSTTTSIITTSSIGGQDCLSVAQKLRLCNSARAAKLAKILSVVEEGNDSGMIEDKYEFVTNQV